MRPIIRLLPIAKALRKLVDRATMFRFAMLRWPLEVSESFEHLKKYAHDIGATAIPQPVLDWIVQSHPTRWINGGELALLTAKYAGMQMWAYATHETLGFVAFVACCVDSYLIVRQVGRWMRKAWRLWNAPDGSPPSAT